MTKHLTPEEFVDVLDGVATPAATSHLNQCEACRTEIAEMKSLASEIRVEDVREPSPLFWEHFSARVAQATAASKPAGPWWAFGWRPIGAMATAAVVLGFVFLNAPGTKEAPPMPANGAALAAALPAISDEDGSWSLVVGLADQADWSEVRQAVTPAEGTADAMIQELTAEQRAALARLLEKEMGDQ